MKKIHIIFNAHIDPIWLWPWEAGLDEVLATCRSACDRLDAHPDIIFTRGEAWVYRQIELVDPELFARIRKHIDAGQWEIVGGWWIQPDCNQPSGWAMEKQIEIGKQYFQNTFGQFPRIGYNVDSFGHAATLPDLMRQAGQDRYIMMRPGKREMELPTSLFRWRGYEDGPEVVTFRLPSAYGIRHMNLEHVQATVANLPEGIEDTMCFVGVGDHGGGPTEEQIAWCREHAHDIDGWEMVFSSPARFFDAIADKIDTLPLVIGELQQHAIGCYSVYRPVKTHLRRAEHLLAQAEIALADPAAMPNSENLLKEPWEEVCFHAFHDTLGGTCLPSAYIAVSDQLGLAASIANKAIAYTLRRKMTFLASDPLQRIVLWNPSTQSFGGYVEFEPWLEWQKWRPNWRLIDEGGSAVPLQIMQSEALMSETPRLLFPLEISPASLRILRIETHNGETSASRVSVSSEEIRTDAGIAYTPDAFLFPNLKPLPLPTLDLIDDPSDTWSHGLDRYASEPLASAIWDAPIVIDGGPLMASLTQEGRVGESRLRAEWRVYADSDFIDLRLEVLWLERHKLLKLSCDFPEHFSTRIDGIMGGHLQRANDGRELPLRDWTLVGKLGIICPDVYAADVTEERIRLTLLRSAIMAHHEPHSGISPRRIFSDQGRHTFRFRFYGGKNVNIDLLEAAAHAMERAPVIADLTRGMPKERSV